MKKAVLILMVVALFSCKKSNVKPVSDPVPVCKTGETNFSGKYVLIGGNHDTISIVFDHNMCPTENSNWYLVYGLGKALDPVTTVPVDYNHVYNILSNESLKNGYSNGGDQINWGFAANGNLICNYTNIGAMNFKKIN